MLKSSVVGLFGLIAVIILPVGIFAVISFIQEKLFITNNSLIWYIKSPISRFVFIYEIYLIFGVFLILSKDLKKWFTSFYKKHGRTVLPVFGILNIILLYAIVTNVAVVTNNKIINHSFLIPQGKQYNYNNIAKITAGIYGKNQFLGPSKGDFYYIIQLKDGTKIDLGDSGSGNARFNDHNNEDDPRFILAKLDRRWVNMGIPKKASMANFKYIPDSLAKIYVNKIRGILENT